MANKLTTCRTCGKEVSTKAKSCPHCGERKPAKKPPSKKRFYLYAALAAVFVLPALMGGNSSTSPTYRGTRSASAPPANTGPDWVTDRTNSEMDDSPTIKIQKDAIAFVDAWPRPTRPSLRIQCQENKTGVLFIIDSGFTPVIGEFGKAEFRIRLDDGKAYSQLWGKSTDGEAAFAPDPISFLKKIRNVKSLKVQFTPVNAGPVTAEFDLTGLPPLMDEVAQVCKWK